MGRESQKILPEAQRTQEIWPLGGATCTSGQKIASIAILLLFSAVALKRFPQGTSTRAQIVTLIALVWLFSNVGVHNKTGSAPPHING